MSTSWVTLFMRYRIDSALNTGRGGDILRTDNGSQIRSGYPAGPFRPANTQHA